jgi:hypothetical protein
MRDERFGNGRGLHGPGPYIADDADHLTSDRAAVDIHLHTGADRVLIGPVAVRHCLVNEDDGARVCGITRREVE